MRLAPQRCAPQSSHFARRRARARALTRAPAALANSRARLSAVSRLSHALIVQAPPSAGLLIVVVLVVVVCRRRLRRRRCRRLSSVRQLRARTRVRCASIARFRTAFRSLRTFGRSPPLSLPPTEIEHAATRHPDA